MLDCLITGGHVVDGSGRPGAVGDVAIEGDRIVGVGDLGAPAAKRVIDAEGRVVAPGFIDVHTHYDAQLLWDPFASPSSLHGVTTIIGGNCGFTIAPLEERDTDYILHMLAKVEGIPVASLRQGVNWNWRTYDEWLSGFEGTLGVNAGFLVGHSTVRRAVMGESATGEASTPEQLDRMRALVDTAIAAGALGFSSSWAASHNDEHGDPVPSRFASREELVALASVVRDHPGTQLEFIPPGSNTVFADSDIDIMTAMSAAGDRPINWNTLVVDALRRDEYEAKLAASDRSREGGGCVVALTLPDLAPLRLSFRNGMVLDALPGWSQTMNLPVDQRVAALRDPEVRARLWEGYQGAEDGPLARLMDWDAIVIGESFSPETAPYVGRSGADIGRERGVRAFDAILDAVVADDLRTGLVCPVAGADDASWEQRRAVWTDDRVLFGGSDAGAHLDMIWGYSYPTALLGESVRGRRLISLEAAIHGMTGKPARLYGLTDRGRLAEGARADVVVFDAETVGRGPVKLRSDMPGGAERLFQAAVGIDHILVNGVETVTAGAHTGATPGTVLRSGRDTHTVTASAYR